MSVLGAIFGDSYQTWLPWKNEHESECPGFGAVLISGIEQADNEQWVLTGTRPDKITNVLIGFNSTTPIGNGEYGQLTLDVTAFAYYDTDDGTPEHGEMWGPDADTWKIKKNGGSLWYVVGADSENELCMLARMGFAMWTGETDAAVTSGTSGTISVTGGGTIGSEDDSGDNQSAYLHGPDVSSGIRVNLKRTGPTNWEFFPTECNP